MTGVPETVVSVERFHERCIAKEKQNPVRGYEILILPW
jgi:hypothetical protein